MKVSKRTDARGCLDFVDVFGAFYCNGKLDDEGFYFKLARKRAVVCVARACLHMGMYEHYTLDWHLDEGGHRNGFINRKWRLMFTGRTIEVREMKKIISEMFEAMGYRLHWISVGRLLNMKSNI